MAVQIIVQGLDGADAIAQLRQMLMAAPGTITTVTAEPPVVADPRQDLLVPDNTGHPPENGGPVNYPATKPKRPRRPRRQATEEEMERFMLPVEPALEGGAVTGAEVQEAATVAAPETAVDAARQYAETHGTAALLAKLQAFGVRRAAEVPAERLGDFITLLRA
jgi:hypothetical protein